MTYSFCDIETYELLTGYDVPTADEAHVQALLDLTSDLVGMYLGETCAARVQTQWPDVLAGVVAYRVHRGQSIPAGIQSESVGSSSVSYVQGQADPLGLLGTEMAVLNMLCGRIGYGRGIGAVSFAGAAFVSTASVPQTLQNIALSQGWPTTWEGWALTNRGEVAEPAPAEPVEPERPPTEGHAITDRDEFFTDS